MAVKSFRDRNPYLVGIASILVIGLIVGGASSIGLFKVLEHTYGMSGVFEDAAGIRNTDPVRLAGVKVGYVSGITADRKNGTVIVKWRVNWGVQLGPDTVAEVALGTLLGAKYLRLSGHVVPPYLGNGAVLDRGHTKTPFDLFDLTKLATKNIEATDTTKLNLLITELADITQGKQGQLRDLLTGISKLSGALNDSDAELRQLLDRADTLSGNLAAKDSTLVALIDQSQGILDLIQRRRSDIKAGLENGNLAVGELARVLDRDKAYLDSILTTLHPTLDLVEKHQGDIDKSLGVLGPAAFGLALAPSHGPWQDVYIRDIGPSVVCALGTLLGTPCVTT